MESMKLKDIRQVSEMSLTVLENEKHLVASVVAPPGEFETEYDFEIAISKLQEYLHEHGFDTLHAEITVTSPYGIKLSADVPKPIKIKEPIRHSGNLAEISTKDGYKISVIFGPLSGEYYVVLPQNDSFRYISGSWDDCLMLLTVLQNMEIGNG